MFVDPVSPVMAKLIDFHDAGMFLVIIVCIVVFNFILGGLEMGGIFRDIKESQQLEVFWTMAPGVCLLFLGVPSFYNLYQMDESPTPLLWVKVLAHQWYWNYSYSYSRFMGDSDGGDTVSLSAPIFLSEEYTFDSYMTPEEELKEGDYRVLEVDHRLVLPVNMVVNLGVTSADVLHCWTVSGLGVKVDAVPGRVNLLNFLGSRSGVFYGQCSELCGPNHSFMPIVIEFTPYYVFLDWFLKTVNETGLWFDLGQDS
uniref:Cytochrome c oxidase subunit 2 n=1 Tax=Cuspidaria undata TaxID=2952366 RepID=A0AAT9T5S6_9BIVA|nr:cytochrome c oxidase subunit II [Cuspidaria undata]USF19203.1 cytochrome c oxidase subunit 2 [Cuspidaria undata]